MKPRQSMKQGESLQTAFGRPFKQRTPLMNGLYGLRKINSVLLWTLNFLVRKCKDPMLCKLKKYLSQLKSVRIYTHKTYIYVYVYIYTPKVTVNIYLCNKEKYSQLYWRCRPTYLKHICQKYGPIYREQVVNPRHQIPKGQPVTTP